MNVENKKFKVMKTRKFQLLAMMVIIATVNIATTSTANAQRRSTQKSKTEKSVEKNSRSRAQAVQKKSTFKDYDTRERNQRNTRYQSNRNVQQNKPKTTVQRNRTANPTNKSAQRPVTTRSNHSITERSATTVRQPKRSQKVARNDNTINNRSRNTSDRVSRTGNPNIQRNATVNRSAVNNDSRYNTSVRRSTGTTETRPGNKGNAVRKGIPNNRVDNRNYYRHDNNDRRYTPNNNYRGSNKYWSHNYRPKRMNYNHANRNFYRRYDYRNYTHWDRRWENYRWNVRSWRDYYNGYNPYSYRYNKYYYHHPVYGDVIRRFVYSPYIFIHNHHRYYSYNGHFFRFVTGIGYVLVDLPFGLAFEQLPYGYDRVNINGYLYFRIGNLFFEYTDYGYRLVHYPERYYSYNDDYTNQGYFFDDDVY
jgi:hypothetical protein